MFNIIFNGSVVKVITIKNILILFHKLMHFLGLTNCLFVCILLNSDLN